MVEPTFKTWGYYLVLHDMAGYKVKELVIHPGKSISLQRHKHRLEHWYVVKGEGMVNLEVSTLPVLATNIVDILAGAWHKVTNTGDKDLVIIEVQMGNYLGEDDIERIGEGDEQHGACEEIA
jgi:mannose-6-phosphate isomerase-like protein (cupin superfamily)